MTINPKLRMILLLSMLVAVSIWSYLIENNQHQVLNDATPHVGEKLPPKMLDNIENQVIPRQVKTIPIRKNLFETRHWNVSLKSAYGLSLKSNSHHPEQNMFSLAQQAKKNINDKLLLNNEDYVIIEEFKFSVEMSETEFTPEIADPIFEIIEPPEPLPFSEIDFVYLGSLKTIDTPAIAFLLQKDKIIGVTEGEKISPNYHLLKILENRINLLHTPDGRTHYTEIRQ